MPTDVTHAPVGKDALPAPRANEPSLSSLVGGILDDAQKLIEQQFAVLKADFRKEKEHARDTGVMLSLGISLLSAAGLLLLFMLVYLLEWLARPNLELWACFALVGGALALVGGVEFYRGRQ